VAWMLDVHLYFTAFSLHKNSLLLNQHNGDDAPQDFGSVTNNITVWDYMTVFAQK